VAVTCLIVDDNAVFLEAARDLLERQGVEVVGVAGSSAEALRRCIELQPDVILVDIELGQESGLELCRMLDQVTDDAAVVLISTYGEGDLGELVDVSPARGFLSKSELSRGAILELLN
jgi:two-component system, NarL family, nitrate/nitrite response regulator NarL